MFQHPSQALGNPVPILSLPSIEVSPQPSIPTIMHLPQVPAAPATLDHAPVVAPQSIEPCEDYSHACHPVGDDPSLSSTSDQTSTPAQELRSAPNSPSTADAIRICGATIQYGQFRAVDNVTLNVGKGDIFGLLGPNGSGKTSLIQALCGLVKLHSGNAQVLGYDVSSSAETIRRKIGYMSQKFSLYADLTVRENMDFYAGIYGLSRQEAKVRQLELIELTGLEPYLQRRAGRLSGGWKQRLAMVCSLMHRPQLVFLDEPTAGVDPVARREIWDLLFQLSSQGITLFVTTHYMDEAERCGQLGYLYLSKLLTVGTPAELRGLEIITPAGKQRFEIRGGVPAEVLNQLRDFPGVVEATIYGNTVHALVDDNFRQDALRSRGLEVVPAEANLEDVFVALTRASQTARVQRAIVQVHGDSPGQQRGMVS